MRLLNLAQILLCATTIPMFLTAKGRAEDSLPGTSSVLAGVTHFTTRCNQRCGLTPSTPDFVDYASENEQEALASLATICSWERSFKLQGEPNCTTDRHSSNNEEADARCVAGAGDCTARATGVYFSSYYQRVKSESPIYGLGSSYAVARQRALDDCNAKMRRWALGDMFLCAVEEVGTTSF